MSLTIKSFLIVTALSSMTIFGMEKSAKAKEYTVGMKILTSTYAGQKINPVHMTITFLGAADDETITKATTLLAAINHMRPLKVQVAEAETFGTKERPINVRRLKIKSPEVEAQLFAIHKELGICEPGQPAKLPIPNWHVSAKDAKLQEEFATKEGTILLGDKLFIKALGPNDPIVELE